jgi:hypothetical protein
MKSAFVSRLASAALLAFVASLLSSPVVATTLDGEAAKRLLSDRDMASKNVAGEGFYYWTWKADGSVCMRLQEKNGQCADTGKWNIERDRVCYAFTWWGMSSGFGANCFRISEVAKGRYEAIQDNGMRLFEFKVGR